MRIVFLFTLLFFISSCGDGAATRNSNLNKPKAPLPVSGYEIVKTYPHDSKAFTQGLAFRDGFLYESTGQEGESTLRKVNIETGKIVQKYDLPDEVFAEGIAMVGDQIYQLSWRDQTAWVYNLADFKLLRELRYTGEGWGLTYDGTNLIMS